MGTCSRSASTAEGRAPFLAKRRRPDGRHDAISPHGRARATKGAGAPHCATPAHCSFRTRAGASLVLIETVARDGGCRTNPRRGRWILPKSGFQNRGGFQNRPSHQSREVRPSRSRHTQPLWRPSPRSRSGSSETALCDSLRPSRESRVRRSRCPLPRRGTQLAVWASCWVMWSMRCRNCLVGEKSTYSASSSASGA
jgi:hypothetical protein